MPWLRKRTGQAFLTAFQAVSTCFPFASGAHCERQTCYADGSIDFDIPSLTLAQAFGVRYTVAVQVNPHVTPFNVAPHGEAGRPISWSSPSGHGRWRGGFILCALEVVLKESFRSAWKAGKA